MSNWYVRTLFPIFIKRSIGPNERQIVLERVANLRRKNDGVLDDLVMEILRCLSSPDLDVRKAALELALDLVSSKTVDEIVSLLNKELRKTVDETYEK
jgi:coatomer subunit beta